VRAERHTTIAELATRRWHTSALVSGYVVQLREAHRRVLAADRVATAGPHADRQETVALIGPERHQERRTVATLALGQNAAGIGRITAECCGR
jgi:hypothetical protein